MAGRIARGPGRRDGLSGTRGDVWDAQKDMALALGGASLAALLERWFGMWHGAGVGKDP